MNCIKRVRDIKNSNFLASSAYNIRGWLTSINDPENLGTYLFGMKLSYNENIDGLTKNPQFNGNINAMVWNAANYGEVQGYGFDYDNINRLTEADYKEKPTTWNDLNKYTVDNLTYDQNGNIETLNREGQADQIDALVYGYTGNQLIKVTDNAIGADTLGFKDGVDLLEEYGYDANGNMVFDENKGIDTIFYNYMNLPEAIVAGNDTIYYIYDADGIKLKKEVYHSGILISEKFYINNFVYNESGLEYILHNEGRIVPTTSGNFECHYNITDHLGNIRVSFRDSLGTAQLIQEDHYYPFGMTMNGLSYVGSGVAESKLKFNGKELQDDVIGGAQLDLYDFGFRQYMQDLGRFTSIDPLTEWHFNYTPYHFTFNNPVNFIDPFGLDTLAVGKDGDPVAHIPEVVITGQKKKSWLKRTLSKIGNWFSEAGESADEFVTGDPEPYSETEVADGVDLDLPDSEESYGNQNVLDRNNPNYKKTFKDKKKNSNNNSNQQQTSDKDMTEDNTGTVKKTDASGRPMDEYVGTEADSTTQTYCVDFTDEGEGKTYRDKKVHKSSKLGRWISKPYKKKK